MSYTVFGHVSNNLLPQEKLAVSPFQSSQIHFALQMVSCFVVDSAPYISLKPVIALSTASCGLIYEIIQIYYVKRGSDLSEIVVIFVS
jgi:hypothetical protein